MQPLSFTGTGQKANTITTGAITMKYTESTNTISMNNALPTTDATGKVRLTKENTLILLYQVQSKEQKTSTGK